VLDLMLPGIDGLEVMRRVRDRSTAIILLTAKGEESDRVIGLRLGADDYVVKPFSPAELVARVDAVLRRVDTVPERAPAMTFGELEIDPGARQVRLDGEPVALTAREFDVLLFLARHPGQAFTREQLMDHVWQYAFYTDTSTVTVHIRRLRAKLEADPDQPRWIETVWGVGYRFAA
jgi:DNA-binding response OmpR family regulator